MVSFCLVEVNLCVGECRKSGFMAVGSRDRLGIYLKIREELTLCVKV